jgi:HEAT repeat protein
MPFVKGKAPDLPSDEKPDDGHASHIAALTSPDVEARWSAARSLGGRGDAVASLARALGAEHVARVREAMMTALMRIGDEASVRALLPYLRSQDARERATAIEALQALPEAIMPFMAALLGDDDSDVRILATELARNMPATEATHVLCRLLEQEQNPNVCAAAVDVLAEVGTRDALPTLKACADRFSNTPFLPFAVATTIARISNAEG